MNRTPPSLIQVHFYFLNHSLLCYLPVHNLVDEKSTKLISRAWISILYFPLSRQESMIFYKTARAVQHRWKEGHWNQLSLLFHMALPFSILLAAWNPLPLRFSFNLKRQISFAHIRSHCKTTHSDRYPQVPHIVIFPSIRSKNYPSGSALRNAVPVGFLSVQRRVYSQGKVSC